MRKHRFLVAKNKEAANKRPLIFCERNMITQLTKAPDVSGRNSRKKNGGEGQETLIEKQYPKEQGKSLCVWKNEGWERSSYQKIS